MMNAARVFDDNKSPKLVDTAAEELRQYIVAMEEENKDIDLSKKHEQCRKAFVKVLEHVAALKVELQL